VLRGFNPGATIDDASSCARARLTLILIIAVGLAVRLAYLRLAIHTPNFTWSDPDGYLHHALLLAGGPNGWHWTFDAVRYEINGQIHALPPLYSVMLSVLALMPGLPHSALVAHVLLSTIAIAFVFGLGRLVHSTATGLWAAGAYALSVSAIFNVWSTSQETLYIPLLLCAFVLLARAMTVDARPLAFAVAGVFFGLAALTRSMPMFFVLPAAALLVATSATPRAAAGQATAFLGGFAVVTMPYCIALSSALGQLTLIDSHGSIHMANPDGATPGVAATAYAVWSRFVDAPRTFIAGCLELARSLLHVNGGRQLQIYVVAGSKATAYVWKLIVHLGTDAVLIVATVLAIPGAALCRNPRVALLFLLWTALNVAVATLGGFGGARLRSPFEPFLLILGSVVLAGAWCPRPRALVAAAIACSVGLALLVIPQIPRSLQAWPDFGIRWDSVLARQHGDLVGAAGLNVPAYTGTAQLAVRAADPSSPVRLDLRANGRSVTTIALDGRERSIAWPSTTQGLEFVEVRAQNAQTGAPAAVHVVVPRR